MWRIVNGLGALRRLLQMEIVELVCRLIMCDRRNLHDIARQIGMFGGSSIYIDLYLRNVQGLSWMGPQNVDRRSWPSCSKLTMSLVNVSLKL